MATVEVVLKTALAHHQRGETAQAEQLYRRVLDALPDQPVALNFLGVVFLQRGAFGDAIRHISQAIEASPDYAAAHVNLGNALEANGDLTRAAQAFRRALELEPDNAIARNNLGNTCLREGRAEEAEACFRRAVELRDDYAEAFNGLGAALTRLGRLDDAHRALTRAIELMPDYGEAHANLGTVLREQGQFFEALTAYQKAVELRPDDADAVFSLARTLKMHGKLTEAETVYRLVLDLRPTHAAAHHNLGNVQRELGRLDDAAASHRRALKLAPDLVEAWSSLGHTLKASGDVEGARDAYEQAASRAPQQPLRALQILMPATPVFRDDAEIADYRASLLRRLGALPAIPSDVDLKTAESSAAPPPIQLLYQGLDDLEIRRAWADHLKPLTRGAEPRDVGDRARVGFLATRNHEGPFLRCMAGLIERLDPERFEPVVFGDAAGEEKLRMGLAGSAARVVSLATRLDRAVEVLREERLDLLHYWEIGTDTRNYLLPFLGVAPRQCGGWGLPVSAGIPEVGFHVSARVVEPPDAASHYLETLVTADRLPTYQRRIESSGEEPTAGEFGLPTERTLYVCAQRPEKLHPQFDDAVRGILEADPRACFVAIGDRHEVATRAIRARWAATLGDRAERAVLLPRMPFASYMRLLRLADVVLDPFHYGGGLTTYDALAVAQSPVTWPGRFARGRYAAGCYEQAGIEGPTAADPDEYVGLAVRIGTDGDYRDAMRRQVSESADAWFEDEAAARAYADALDRMLGRNP